MLLFQMIGSASASHNDVTVFWSIFAFVRSTQMHGPTHSTVGVENEEREEMSWHDDSRSSPGRHAILVQAEEVEWKEVTVVLVPDELILHSHSHTEREREAERQR